MQRLILLISACFLFLIHSCEMPVPHFDKIQDAQYVEKEKKTDAPAPDSSVIVMTWNIRYGFGRGPWFGDACGYKVIYTRDEIMANVKALAEKIMIVKPDILLLQEADINSTRSAYVDELKYILENTWFNYAVYGYQWKASNIPSDGLGRVEETNAILSRWPLLDGKRIGLDIRSDQGALERYFYERSCMVKARTQIPGFKDLYVVCIHASAFATDDTKHSHIVEFTDELNNLADSGYMFVAGGDLNTLPPGSTKTDYCIEDMCEGESYHQPGNDPMHKDGSNYTPESDWLVPLYNSYKNIIPLSLYASNEAKYFTHTTRPEHVWDRTLDYLFTNNRWRSGASFVRQDFFVESDHVAVGGELILLRK